MYYDESWKFGLDGQLHQDAAEVAKRSRQRDLRAMGIKTVSSGLLWFVFLSSIAVWAFAGYGLFELLKR